MRQQPFNDKMLAHLLRSSLPLEHQVGMIAHRSGYIVNGEFSYGRENEHGRVTDFSVDLLISSDLSGHCDDVEVDKYLNVLLECKYASPAVAWVFSTAPNHEPGTMTAFSPFQWLGTHLIYGFNGMKTLEPPVYCTRGVSLSPDSADPKQMRHGMQQLRFAVPKLLESLCDYCLTPEEPVIPLIAPILVTNAPLYVLGDDAILPGIEGARALSDLATEHTHLAVYQKAGPELMALCRSTASAIVGTHLQGRLENVIDLLTDELVDAVECVTVVSLAYLPAYLASLKSVVSGLTVASRVEVGRQLAEARSA